MSEDREPTTFAAVEFREWTNSDVAQSYARLFAQAADMAVPVMVEAVGVKPGTRALDLCCGHGNVAAGLSHAGAHVVGLDFSASMLAMARVSVPEAQFVEGDAMSLTFDDASFDAVTIGFGLPHVPDPEVVLAETRRVLKPGGRLAFSVWCGPEVEGAFGYVFGAIAHHGSPDIALPPGPGAHDYADLNLASKVLTATGFSDCRQSKVAAEWRLSDPGAPFDFFLKGTARGGALLRPQPPENAAAIRAAIVSQVRENHGKGPQWRVPVPAVVTSAVAA